MVKRIEPKDLNEMLPQTDKIRNICILAHVDHGKTTLSDSLVCSNGVISSKLAGKLRYLDSTEEEQRRGITMHSSAISLVYDLEKVTSSSSSGSNAESSSNDTNQRYLINLVDSPGHMDFSSDVSTATRLCDGALIVIDVLEGICTQTHAVMFKALKERMRPCLILNKIDRLIIDMKLTSTEAFYHLRRLVEKANALAFTLVNSEIRSYEENKLNHLNTNPQQLLDSEQLLEEWRLVPEKGNILFASALDCWGFGIGKFTTLWANKLRINKNALQKYFFGDYSLNLDDKKVLKYDPQDSGNSDKKPMFAALVLDPIWQLYDAAIVNQDPAKAALMAKKIGVDLPPREINIRDPRSTIQAIFRRWLSLSDAVLRMVVRCMPDPTEAQRNRLGTLLDMKHQYKYSHRLLNTADNNDSYNSSNNSSSTEAELQNKIVNRVAKIQKSIACCGTDRNSDDVIVFVSKMIPVKLSELSRQDCIMVKAQIQATYAASVAAMNSNNDVDENSSSVSQSAELVIDEITHEVFVAVGRVFSGVLTRNTNLYVLSSRHDPLAERIGDKGNDRMKGSKINSQSTVHTVSTVDVDSNNGTGSGSNNSNVNNSNSKNDTTTLINGELESDVPTSLSITAKHVPSSSFGLYLCLGPSVVSVGEVSAGNLVAIVGLDQLVLKTATLASTWACQPLKSMTFQARPIVRVAVEPKSHLDLPRLEAGLMSLYQYDPAVEVGVDESGQHTVSCLGELHLEQCLKSLTERFAKCEIVSSEPLVPYRETIVPVVTDGTGTATAFKPCLPPPWCDTPGLAFTGVQSSSGSNSSSGSSSESSNSSSSGGGMHHSHHASASTTTMNTYCTSSGKSRMIVPLGSSGSAGSGSSGSTNHHLSVHFSCLPLPPDIIKLIEKTNSNEDISSDSNNSYSTSSSSSSSSESSTTVIWNLSEQISKAVWSFTYLPDLYSSVATLNSNSSSSSSSSSSSDNASSSSNSSSDNASSSSNSSSLQLFLQEYIRLIKAHGVVADDSVNSLSDYEMSYSRLGYNISNNNISNSNNNQDETILSLLVSFGSKSVLTNTLVMNPKLTIDLYSDRKEGSGGDSGTAIIAPYKLGSFQLFNNQNSTTNNSATSSLQKQIFLLLWNRLQNSMIAGFQECCNSGPIMNESLHGVCYSIDCIEVSLNTCLSCCGVSSSGSHSITIQDILTAFNCTSSVIDTTTTTLTPPVFSSGQIISEVKSALRLCMLSSPLRIVEPVYACDLQCDQSQLGHLYGVLSKRRGEVTKEDIIDGTSLFILSATLPVSESFGFAQELLRKTSGNATAPQLLFSHWQIIPEDPFWRPKTEEELEEYGDSYVNEHNIFRVRIDKIRKRKGLAIEEKVVAVAEKQRNMNKKK